MTNSLKQLIISALIILIFFACQQKNGSKNAEAIILKQPEGAIEALHQKKMMEKLQQGKTVYINNCQDCHMEDGTGVPNLHPPLTPGSWVEKEPKELIAILMKGLSGKIEVNGQIYKEFMPSNADLTDEEIADVLTYIRNSFGNQLSTVTSEEVRKIRSGK